MDQELLNKTMRIAEEFFGTASDPEQIPINTESFLKLQRLHEKTFVCKEVDGEPISWIIVIPTQKQLAESFLSGKITERELLDSSEPQEKFEALYFCSAFTVPEHRGQGLAKKLLLTAFMAIPLVGDPLLFAWPTSEAGVELTKELEKLLDKKIRIKKNRTTEGGARA